MEQKTDSVADIIIKPESPPGQLQSNPINIISENMEEPNKSLEISEQNIVIQTNIVNDKLSECDVLPTCDPGSEVHGHDSSSFSLGAEEDATQHECSSEVIDDMYKFPKIPRLTLPSDSSDTSLATPVKNLDLDLSTDQSSNLFPPENDTLNEETDIASADAANAEELSKKLIDNSLDQPMVSEQDESESQNEGTAPIEESSEVGPYYLDYIFDDSLSPLLLAVSKKEAEFPASSFLKGCKWAPDGSCLLTNSDDSTLRLFNFPSNVGHVEDWDNVQSDTIDVDSSWGSALKIREGGCVYDYCWYPFASSLDPATTCFLTTSKDTPVHLWDAMYGNLRATYLAYNDVDEPTAAYSVAFDPTGQNIYCGYDKSIRIFNISRPGRICTVRKLTGNVLPDLNQHGLVSCIAFNAAWSNVYACGSYRKKTGLYMEDGSVINMLEGHTGGVTHLVFSRDGTKLYTGARSDPKLICWDLRNMGSEYKVYDRVVNTQQRIYFELTTNDRYLISGSTDGVVRIWDTLEENKEAVKLPANSDCVNGVSINPYIPVLATSTGQREYYDMSEDSNSDSDDDLFLRAKSKFEHSCDVKLWKL